MVTAPRRFALLRTLTVAAAGVAAFARGGAAQAAAAGDLGGGHFETRADLEAQAREAEAQHRTGEAWLLRNRLKQGDFQEGDRILFSLGAGNALIDMPGRNGVDTLVVRTGKVIQFPHMDDLSLDGVLRSELSDRVTAHLAKYIRDPVVHVSPLLRIAVLGHVTRNGYLYTSADALLTDVIMQAGGPTADGDLQKVTVRRGTDVIWNADDIRTAMADGLTLDRLHLRAGDQIEVGGRQQFSWLTAVQVSALVATLALTLIRLK